MTKAKNKITGNMPIGEIVDKYPKLAEILTEGYGFHCIGCFGSTMETLEEGAMVHGMKKGEITKMIAELNSALVGQ